MGDSHAVSHGGSHAQDRAVDGAVGLYAAGNELLTTDIQMVEPSLNGLAGSIQAVFAISVVMSIRQATLAHVDACS